MCIIPDAALYHILSGYLRSGVTGGIAVKRRRRYIATDKTTVKTNRKSHEIL
jgi:hypothetical protein